MISEEAAVSFCFSNNIQPMRLSELFRFMKFAFFFFFISCALPFLSTTLYLILFFFLSDNENFFLVRRSMRASFAQGLRIFVVWGTEMVVM